jgi:hypothetical protein
VFHKKYCRIHTPFSDCRRKKKLLISQMVEFIEYRRNWKEHVDRMSSDRIPE